MLYFDDLQCSFVLLQQSMQMATSILSVRGKALDQPEHNLKGIKKDKRLYMQVRLLFPSSALQQHRSPLL